MTNKELYRAPVTLYTVALFKLTPEYLIFYITSQYREYI